ncbi:type II secretion system protein GspJ [Arenicella chitinivorans]|uniref:Type II secretion system protein J n=1 Tax=Arenicella chitinivorans TaxID=1329800 RepID=A0A918RQE4_9GAMM|nr:type II secretion system minor pseudopilin GspJ [Arenicella chitinivorans]GHA08935.1 type II secretion system protein GspJ [Arenicella chitinivorans]
MRAQRRSGFTLIEVMVSVAIFAVIGAIVFPALIQFIDIRDRVLAKHEQIEQLQKTFLFMSKDLRFAANRLGKDEYGEFGDATLLVGEDSLIDLTAMYPDLNLAGLNVPRRVRWVLEEKALYRLQSPVMDPDGDTRVFKQKLLDGVRDVEFELSKVEDGRDSTSKRWKEKTRLPDMIKVTITLENKAEYERLFTMLSGDNLAAVAASTNSQGQPQGQARPQDQDGD